MMYQGTTALYFCWVLRMYSAMHSKSAILRMAVAGKVPLGASQPRRVPCPPATVKAATLFSRMSCSPSLRACVYLVFCPRGGTLGYHGAGAMFSGSLKTG